MQQWKAFFFLFLIKKPKLSRTENIQDILEAEKDFEALNEAV